MDGFMGSCLRGIVAVWIYPDLSICGFTGLWAWVYEVHGDLMFQWCFSNLRFSFTPLSHPFQVNLKHHLFEVQTEIVEKVALEDGAGVFRLIREQKVTNEFMFG